MCDKLFDDARLGMTHREVKQCTQMFIDIIELGRTNDDADDVADGRPTATLFSRNGDDDDDEGGGGRKTAEHHDPVGYAELLQVLQNNIWSNVDMQQVLSGKQKPAAGNEERTFQQDLEEFLHLSQAEAGCGDDSIREEMFAASDKQFVKEVADLMMTGQRTADRANRLSADLSALSVNDSEPDPADSECILNRVLGNRLPIELFDFLINHSRTLEIRENTQRCVVFPSERLIAVGQRALCVHANVRGRLRRADRRRPDGRQWRRTGGSRQRLVFVYVK